MAITVTPSIQQNAKLLLMIAVFAITSCSQEDNDSGTETAELSMQERDTCVTDCVAAGAPQSACEERCSFVEDAFGACYEGCLERDLSPEACRESCSGEWRDEYENTASPDECFADCVDNGGTDQDCLDRCDGVPPQASSPRDEEMAQMEACINDCVDAGGTDEVCRQECS